MEGKINQYDNPLTLEQVCSTLILKFERLNLSNEDDIYDKEIDKALVTIQFKVRCNNCVKYGHKKQDFRGNGNNDKRKNNTGNKGSFNGTCNYCNKCGYKQVDCYKKHRNEQVNYNGTFNYCNKFGRKQ